MGAMKMRQVELYRSPYGENLRTMTWVPTEFRPHRFMTLRGSDGRLWKVLNAYKVELDHGEINRGWKVGGL